MLCVHPLAFTRNIQQTTNWWYCFYFQIKEKQKKTNKKNSSFFVYCCFESQLPVNDTCHIELVPRGRKKEKKVNYKKSQCPGLAVKSRWSQDQSSKRQQENTLQPPTPENKKYISKMSSAERFTSMQCVKAEISSRDLDKRYWPAYAQSSQDACKRTTSQQRCFDDDKVPAVCPFVLLIVVLSP